MEIPLSNQQASTLPQTATRAEQDGADTETIVCALLHDIGDVISPVNHSQASAAILRPYISEKLLDSSESWIISRLLLDAPLWRG